MCHPGCGHRSGISSRTLKKMVDDFYLVEDALTHAISGTGLSLVIKVITAMDGIMDTRYSRNTS